MSLRVTVKRWTYDNAQRHVTAFQLISEAAHSWSYDNQIWWHSVESIALVWHFQPRVHHIWMLDSLPCISFTLPRYTVIHPKWRWALSHVHCFMVTRCDIIMSHMWHYNVTQCDVTWCSINALSFTSGHVTLSLGMCEMATGSVFGHWNGENKLAT